MYLSESLQNGQRYGKHFLFRDRCQCLILPHQGHSISQLTELFKVHRVTSYEWFNLWESGSIKALHKKPGQGRRPKLSPANPKHVERARALVENERQNLKTVVNGIGDVCDQFFPNAVLGLQIYQKRKKVKAPKSSKSSNASTIGVMQLKHRQTQVYCK